MKITGERTKEYTVTIETENILKLIPDFFEMWSDAISPMDSWEEFAEYLIHNAEERDIEYVGIVKKNGSRPYTYEHESVGAISGFIDITEVDDDISITGMAV